MLSGVFATVVAVTMASRQFRRGDRVSMNQWLRFRVAAQGFTILAICTYGFALRWRKKNEDNTVDTSRTIDKPGMLGEGRGSIVGNVQVTPAALLREAAKEKEKGDFEKRLEEAIVKDRAEKDHKESGKEKPDWKTAWKEGLLQKNRENDARRVRPAERKD
jgi:Hypoxia induced protein conserved region